MLLKPNYSSNDALDLKHRKIKQFIGRIWNAMYYKKENSSKSERQTLIYYSMIFIGKKMCTWVFLLFVQVQEEEWSRRDHSGGYVKFDIFLPKISQPHNLWRYNLARMKRIRLRHILVQQSTVYSKTTIKAVCPRPNRVQVLPNR